MATHEIAQGIAKLGRHGDSTLMHVTPHEVAGLQALAKSQGTSLTINPQTGLPEAFNLGGLFSSLLPTIAGFGASMIPGLQPMGLSAMQAGILAGAATGALTSKDPLTGALMGGLGGYGGAGLGKAAAGFSATNAGMDLANPLVQDQLKQTAAANAAGNVGAAGNTALGIPSFDLAPLNATGPGIKLTSGALPGFATDTSLAFKPTMAPIVNNLASTARATAAPTFGSNLQQAYSNVAANPLEFIGQNKMAVGMPLAGAVMGGLEPSDLYGDAMKPSEKEKYDPYATLNLGGDSGLRLYAHGGPVSFADGGDANKALSLDSPSVGTGAMEGSGQYEVTPGGTKLGLFATTEQIAAAKQADEMAKASSMQGLGLGGLGMSAFQRSMAGLKDRPEYAGVARNLEGFSSTGRMNLAPTAKTAATGYDQLVHLNMNQTYADGGAIDTTGMQGQYGNSDNSNPPNLSQDGYGLGRLNAMSQGGIPSYAEGGYLDGPGDGMSDSIPATIEGKQPARLADGEFVVPADVVSHLGNGSTKAGSQRLYGMLDKVRKARTGSKKQGKQINPSKYMPS